MGQPLSDLTKPPWPKSLPVTDISRSLVRAVSTLLTPDPPLTLLINVLDETQEPVMLGFPAPGLLFPLVLQWPYEWPYVLVGIGKIFKKALGPGR